MSNKYQPFVTSREPLADADQIGDGISGDVWRLRSNRDVACKIFDNHSVFKQEWNIYKQLARQPKLSGRIPNLIRAEDMSETDGQRSCLKMEFIDGRTLQECASSMTVEELTDIQQECGVIFGLLLDADVTHGDLNANNIMIRQKYLDERRAKPATKAQQGDVVIIDFGYAVQKKRNEAEVDKDRTQLRKIFDDLREAKHERHSKKESI